ncbi:MAG: MFS transporter [Chloroflexi bacterium]|nr:MFS transporter [Chloroflexota bacterium]
MNFVYSKDLRHNITVNVLDGAFFGLALGFASFVTIIPLFVSTLTDSAILIGLIPAIHAVGWQLPQLFSARRLARAPLYRPIVTRISLNERLPLLGLAIVAWLVADIGKEWALALTFALLIWQGLGAGFAANPWQSMLAKILPSNMRGMFYGIQAAAANGLSSISAVVAGLALATLDYPWDYAICFLASAVAMMVSWGFLVLTREQPSPPVEDTGMEAHFWQGVAQILRHDHRFRWFLAARTLASFATLGFAFYTVYVVRYHQVSEAAVGVMTAVLTGAQIVANPLMGWLADRWNHLSVMKMGILACLGSALVAWLSPHPAWFYLAFILAGVGNVAIWTVGLAYILDFGTEETRPAYIGLANTLIAPSTILAPLFGGWLADQAGYPAAFLASAVCAVITFLVFQWRLPSPPKSPPQ